MNRWIAGTIGLMFLLEGTLTVWNVPSSWQQNTVTAPQLVLVALLYVAMYVHRYHALVYGLAVGFLQDYVYYGHALGVQAFSLALTAYAIGFLFRFVQPSLVSTLAAVTVGSFAYQFLLYALYRFVLRTTDAPADWLLARQIVPSTIITLLFALAVYIPARRFIERQTGRREADERFSA